MIRKGIIFNVVFVGFISIFLPLSKYVLISKMFWINDLALAGIFLNRQIILPQYLNPANCHFFILRMHVLGTRAGHIETLNQG